MFAVIKTGGKQYRVAASDLIKVDKVAGEPGELVEFGEVLVVGGDSVTIGAPTVAGATVAGEVVAHDRGPKIIAFKKRRRKNSRRKRGHRQDFTLIRITEILTDGRKPTPREKKPEAAPVPTPAEAAGTEGQAKAKPKADRKAAAKPKAGAKATAKPKSAAPKGKRKDK
jgi:large subunit ribosomal protein L21